MMSKTKLVIIALPALPIKKNLYQMDFDTKVLIPLPTEDIY